MKENQSSLFCNEDGEGCNNQEKTRALQKTVNVSQPVVERHCVDIDDPQSNSQARYISEAGTLEILIILYWEIVRC
jgi:hypothetical protein